MKKKKQLAGEPPELQDFLDEDSDEIAEILQLKGTLKAKEEESLPELFIRATGK
jgi:hypothetical protein